LSTPTDYILLNNEKIQQKILEHYASQNEWPVLDDLKPNKKQKAANIDWSKLIIKRHQLLSTVLVKHDLSHTIVYSDMIKTN
jgi:hypothetical protein